MVKLELLVNCVDCSVQHSEEMVGCGGDNTDVVKHVTLATDDEKYPNGGR